MKDNKWCHEIPKGVMKVHGFEGVGPGYCSRSLFQFLTMGWHTNKPTLAETGQHGGLEWWERSGGICSGGGESGREVFWGRWRAGGPAVSSR